jgi:hypothetical protein
MGAVLNQHNTFNGRVDPTPHFNGFYAADIPQLVQKYSALVDVLTKLLNYLKSK